MLAHELAQKLLELPNVEVVIPYKRDSFETITSILHHVFDEEFRFPDEPKETIYLSGELFKTLAS